MSYSYSTPLTYGPTSPITYDNEPANTVKKNSSIPLGVTGAVAGGIGGCIYGHKTNPFIGKNGEATDSFSKKVYLKYIDKASDATKKAYNQKMEIYKEIDKIKNADDLRAFFAARPEANLKLEADFLNNIDANNLAESKEKIKTTIKAYTEASLQNLKNKIKTYWDANTKKFIKPHGGNEKVFDAINAAVKGTKFKLVAKYGAIGAAVTGALAVVLHKLFSKNSSNI